MRSKDKLYPHKYKPIITKELFDKVQKIKASYNKKRGYKFAGLPFLYRGLIRCADCGCIITPERKIKPSGRVYHYYHCTQYHGKHGAQWIREEELTEQFANLFKRIKIPKTVLKEITKTLKSVHKGKVEFRKQYAQQLNKEKEKYTKRLENLYLDKLDGSITEDEYNKFYTRFREKINEIDGKLASLQKAEDEYYITANYLLELANRAYELFKSSEAEEKRQLLKLVLQNCTLKGRKLQFTLKKPFDSILFCASRQAWLPGEDSNLRPTA
ncbi:recombinase zinc beta ribbon domain-containing protein [bacterium]|nr:recombinase zinc beta ribbon domain-containing protein [bacterium]